MWFEGFIHGTILTAGIIGGGYLIYRIVTRRRRHDRMMENLGALYDAGYRAGQRSNEESFLSIRGNYKLLSEQKASVRKGAFFMQKRTNYRRGTAKHKDDVICYVGVGVVICR